MLFKILCVTACVSLALAAPRKSASVPNERIAAYYVKDDDNGELRFLTSGASGSNGVNSALNQYITQKQDLLEQLRPTNNNNIGTGGFGGTGSGFTGFTGSGTANGITPIVVNLGNTGANQATQANNAAITGASPIVDLLPQIVAQTVSGNRRRVVAPNRRRVGAQNQRRRRPNRGGNKNKNNNVYVIRPREF